jgi:hypothetical protein
MKYETPRLLSLGSIANHTYEGFPPKGGIPPNAHIDTHCEWSGGSGENKIDPSECNPVINGDRG